MSAADPVRYRWEGSRERGEWRPAAPMNLDEIGWIMRRTGDEPMFILENGQTVRVRMKKESAR